MINSQTTIQEVKRGEIWLTKLMGEGSVQGGIRPVIIVSNFQNNKFSPVLTVIPLTSKLNKKPLPTHVLINELKGLSEVSVVLCEQILTSPKSSLIKKLSECTDEIMSEIDNAMRIQLQIDKPSNMKNFPIPQKHQAEAFDITRVQIIKRGIESLERVLMENSINNITNILNDIQGLVNELKNYCDKFNVNYSLYYKSRLHAISNNKTRMCI